jgi:hypothetical protein
MKIRICDVCYRDHGKARNAAYSSSYKDRSRGLRVAVDTCVEHKGFFRSVSSFEEAEKKTTALYNRTVLSLDKLFLSK